jgi:hypothetical protein
MAFLVCIGFHIVTHAQGSSGGSGVQNPTFRTESGKIEFLLGSFATAVSMPPAPMMPNGATGKGTSVMTWALDSMFISIEEQSVNSLFGRYLGHGMLGYDSQSRQFVLSMFNNFGDRPTYKGNMEGDTLVLQTKVPSPRGTFDQKLLWYKEGGSVKLKVLNDAGKGFATVVEQTATPVTRKTN